MNKKNQKLKTKQKPEEKLTGRSIIEKLSSSDWFIVLLFFITTLIVYSNSFHVPFQFDDDQQIALRVSNHSFNNFSHLSYWLNVNNRPVSTLTLVANYVLGGEDVVGYHVVNFLIHLLSGIILFFWLTLVFSLVTKQKVSKWLPVVITLFFLLHPVQIQSVTYIVQRMTSLAGMFFLLSVFLYTKGRVSDLKSGKNGWTIVYYIFAFFAGILGTFSKQSAVVFPLAMLLIELFFIRDANGKLFKRYLLSAVGAGIFCSIGYFLFLGFPSETKNITPVEYFATQMTVIPRYFQMMLIPIGLSIDHGVKVVKSIVELKVILGAAFLLGILVFAAFQFKKRPVVSFGIFWIFVAMIIESSIFPIRDVMFEQRMYLPLVGFSIVIWTLFFEFFSATRAKYLTPFVLFALMSMSVGTFARNRVWNSRTEIWKKVTEMYPNHFRAWQGLGREYVAGGEKDIYKIIGCYEKALKIEPDNQTVLNDLAANYLKNGDYSQAINCSLKLERSSNLKYRVNSFRILGIIYLNSKQYDLAIKYLKKLVKIEKDDTAALLNLSTLYIQKGDYNNAILCAEKTLEISPNEILALLNIGYSQINMGKSDLSKKYLLKAMNIDPVNIRALVLYANACINTGEMDEAIACLKKAYDITKDKKFLLDIEKVEKLR